MLTFVKNYWKTISWFLLMCYLLFSPDKNLPKGGHIEIPHFDKFVHLSMFLILVFLYRLDSAYNKKGWLLYTVIAGTVLFGILSEIIQLLYISGRSGSFYDFLADLTGVILGIVLFGFYSKSRLRKNANTSR